MKLFNFFKKRKKVEQVYEYSHDDLQWNKMWDLWAKGDIESPYSELMEYLNGINGGGHHCHYDNIDGNSDLKEYVNALTRILPEPLKNNALVAYEAYSSNVENISDVLDKCDDVYYANEELINNILKERASNIEL